MDTVDTSAPSCSGGWAGKSDTDFWEAKCLTFLGIDWEPKELVLYLFLTLLLCSYEMRFRDGSKVTL